MQEIAKEGYKTVINLALPTSQFALTDEKSIVESLGMRSINIPVRFDNPTRDDLDAFFAAMHDFHRETGEKIWVHCVVNMRVSSFIYLWRVLVCGVPLEEAEIELHDIWVPEKDNATWHAFIQQALTEPIQTG